MANAIVLPYVLDYYGDSIHKPLAELADLIGISEFGHTEEKKAKKFIEAIKQLNQDMKIPTKVNGIEDRDIPVMVDRALDEANPLYPVPKILTKREMYELYQLIKE